MVTVIYGIHEEDVVEGLEEITYEVFNTDSVEPAEDIDGRELGKKRFYSIDKAISYANWLNTKFSTNDVLHLGEAI